MRALALLLTVGGLPMARAQTDVRVAEYRIKAAFLFKFLPFVEWPVQTFERTDSPLVVGVLGASELADELEVIVGSRLVNERRVQVRRLHKGEVPNDLHVVFVAVSTNAALPLLVAAHRGRALLTVGEADDAARAVSAINFVVVDDRVRFDIALGPAEIGQISISSRLLALARRVVPSNS